MQSSTIVNDIDYCKTHYRAIDVCLHLLPHGHQDHKEWVATNPNRNDQSEGSFSVNIEVGGPREGLWGEFAGGIQLTRANGEKKIGGDIVDLWAYLRGFGNSYEAARQMKAELQDVKFFPYPQHIPQFREKPEDAVEIIMPIPDDAPSLGKVTHGMFGRPTTWPMYHYRTQDGRTMGYVARWDLEDGNKEIRPYFLHLCRDTKPRWQWKGPEGIKPMYGLDRITRATQTIIVVEGEKAADAGQSFGLPAAAVITWMGGAKAAGRADVSMIRNMRIILIPDRDCEKYDTGEFLLYEQQPGVAAMLALWKLFEANGCTVSIIDYTPGESKHGWDLADAKAEEWTTDRLQELLLARRRFLTKPSISPAVFEGLGNLPFDLPLDPDLSPLECRAGRGFKPLNVWQNVAKILQTHGVVCRQNLMKDDQEFLHVKSQKPFDVNELSSMLERNNIPTSDSLLRKHLGVIAFRNAYHPAYDWVRSQDWDGIDRIKDLFRTLTISQTPIELAFKLFYRALIQAVAMMSQEVTNEFGDAPEAHGVLTFVGHQGIGKSRWIRHLAPPKFSLPGHVLSIGDKDSEIAAISHWIVELGEVSATHGKSGSAKLKAWLGKSFDVMRKHYDARARDIPRRTTFLASENHVQYLIDETGNRRWWTIRVDHMDYQHTINMQQLWAQALTHLRAGAQWWLTDAEMAALNANNEAHQQTCPVSDMIAGGLLWTAPRATWTWRRTTQILMDVCYPRPENTAACRSAAGYLRGRGCPERIEDHASAFAVPPIGRDFAKYFPDLVIPTDDEPL